jgi:predicted transposase YdaD
VTKKKRFITSAAEEGLREGGVAGRQVFRRVGIAETRQEEVRFDGRRN